MFPIPTPTELCNAAAKTEEFTRLLTACIESLNSAKLYRVPAEGSQAVVQAVVRALVERGWSVQVLTDHENHQDYIHINFPKES